MGYIRIKKIQNKEYAYLVESIHTQNGPRQKVKQYLGKVHRFAVKDEIMHKNIDWADKNKFLSSLVAAKLLSAGFIKNTKGWQRESLVFCPKKLTIHNQTASCKNEAVISLGEGFISTFTLQRIMNFKKSADVTKDGYILAKYFLEAGLRIEKEEFVGFYRLL